jgi:hypothetical protein
MKSEWIAQETEMENYKKNILDQIYTELVYGRINTTKLELLK